LPKDVTLSKTDFMGKVNGDSPLGTVGNICIYELRGNLYHRKKSSLTRERVLKDKGFAKTRKYAGDMGRAARIGSVIYKALPADIKHRWFYRAITGEAASLLYKGKDEQEVKDILWKKYIENTGCRSKEAEELASSGRSKRNLFKSSKESRLSLRQIFEKRWEKQGKMMRYFRQAWQKTGNFNEERFREMLNQIGPVWRRAYKPS
jgi:hypothetical protein